MGTMMGAQQEEEQRNDDLGAISWLGLYSWRHSAILKYATKTVDQAAQAEAAHSAVRSRPRHLNLVTRVKTT